MDNQNNNYQSPMDNYVPIVKNPNMENQSINNVVDQPVSNSINNGVNKKTNVGLIIVLILVPFILLIGGLGITVFLLLFSKNIEVNGGTPINTTTVSTSNINKDEINVNTPKPVDEIDGINFSLYDNDLCFFGSTYETLKNKVMGYISLDKSDTDLLENRYQLQSSYPGASKDYSSRTVTLTTYFINTSSSDKKLKDSGLFEFSLEANDHYNGKSFKDTDAKFNLGGGITQEITEEEALSILGKTNYDYTSDAYHYTEHQWKTKDYKIILAFNENGLFKVVYETYKY